MVFGKCWHSHGKPLSSYKMDVRFVSSEPKNVNTKKFLKKLNTLGEVDIPYRRVVQQPQEKSTEASVHKCGKSRTSKIFKFYDIKRELKRKCVF